jgi:hypothetical protein
VSSLDRGATVADRPSQPPGARDLGVIVGQEPGARRGTRCVTVSQNGVTVPAQSWAVVPKRIRVGCASSTPHGIRDVVLAREIFLTECRISAP